MTVQLTTSDLLARGTAHLAPVLEQPSLDAGLLLAFALGCARVRLKSHPEEPRTSADEARYLALIERRAQGEPLAYITGVREFWTLELRVTRDVLVPRPETELLVERALLLVPAAQARVLDLGTGSGAIALAVAAERPSLGAAGNRRLARRHWPSPATMPGDCGSPTSASTPVPGFPDSPTAALTWWSAIRRTWMPATRRCWRSRTSRARR